MTESAVLRHHESSNARSQLQFATRRGWRIELEETTDDYYVYRVYPSHAYSYEIRVAK